MTPDEIAQFLGTRFWLQVNRSCATDWQYVARIGLQDLVNEPRALGRQQAMCIHEHLPEAISGAIAAMKEMEAV